MKDPIAQLFPFPTQEKKWLVRKRNTSYFCFVLFRFLRNETKRISFDFRVNYLHSEVEWPIKKEFVIESLNINVMQKQTCEYLKYRKS